MATITICDRCAAVAQAKPSRTITIPKEAPGTNAVTKDVSVAVAVTSDADLCRVCLASAMKVLQKLVNPS